MVDSAPDLAYTQYDNIIIFPLEATMKKSRECFFDLIIKIYALSQATRVYGLLYLEEVLEGIEPDFLRRGWS